MCAGAHDGEDILLHTVRQDLQRVANAAAPPEDPQLRVPRAVRRLQEGVQNQVAGGKVFLKNKLCAKNVKRLWKERQNVVWVECY